MIKNRLTLIISFLLYSVYVISQTDKVLPVGIAPAGADVAYTQKWLAWSNPSILARTKDYSLTLGYENRYFISSLSDEYVYLSIPTNYINIGCAYKFFGYKDYNEMMLSLTVARKFGIVSLGVEFDYFNLHTSSEKGYRHAFTAQFGLQVDITKQCVVGFRMFNPCFSKIKEFDNLKKLPVIMQVGINYTFIDKIDLLVQLGYTLNNGVAWAVGMEYRIMPQLLVRLGAHGANYVIPSLGAGVRFGNFGFDLLAEEDFRIGMILVGNLHYKF